MTTVITSFVGIIMLFIVSMGCFVYAAGSMICDLFDCIKRDAYVGAALIWLFCLLMMFSLIRG